MEYPKEGEGSNFRTSKLLQKFSESSNSLSAISFSHSFFGFTASQLKGKSSRSGDSYQHHFDCVWHQGHIRFQHIIMKGWGEHLPVMEPFATFQDQQPLPWSTNIKGTISSCRLWSQLWQPYYYFWLTNPRKYEFVGYISLGICKMEQISEMY